MDIVFDRVPCRAEVDFVYGGVHHRQGIDGLGSLTSTQTNPYLLLDQASIDAKFASFDFPALDLSYYGAKAFNRLDPTRDRRNLPDAAQFIIELIKDGIPSVPLKIFSRLATFRSLGDEYLNAIFGWRALLSDLSSLLSTYQRIDSVLAQLRADNGHSVRRKGTLSYTKDVSARSTMGPTSDIRVYPGTGLFTNIGKDPAPYGPEEYWTETEERVWFAGKGSYILSSDLLDSPSYSDLEDFLLLLSKTPSPSTVYRVIPWTWLINYFSNLGEIVEQALGHGVGDYTADYCYLMRKHTRTEYFSVANHMRFGLQDPTNWDKTVSAPVSRNAFAYVRCTTLERVAATPFGFGVTLSGLTPAQLAILTALGLSRQNFI
jgi:hypothetical protein